MRWLLALVLFSALVPATAQEFTVDAHWIDRCIGVHDNPMICVGQAAEECTQPHGVGGPNMVVAACHEAEFVFWDRALNEAYQDLVRLARLREADDLGYAPDNLEFALREVQLAWIGYRDATCGNALALAAPFGSAAGAAYQACMSRQTARQYFELRRMRRDYAQ